MNEQLFGIGLTAIGLCAVALIGMLGNIIVKRVKPSLTTPEMWERLDKLTDVVYGNAGEPGLLQRVSIAEERAETADRKAAATGRILRDLSGQWQGPKPNLNPYDLAELDVKYIPASHPWRMGLPATNPNPLPNTS